MLHSSRRAALALKGAARHFPVNNARRAMADYVAPLNDMTFAVHEVHKFEDHYKTLKDATARECDKDTIGALVRA